MKSTGLNPNTIQPQQHPQPDAAPPAGAQTAAPPLHLQPAPTVPHGPVAPLTARKLTHLGDGPLSVLLPYLTLQDRCSLMLTAKALAKLPGPQQTELMTSLAARPGLVAAQKALIEELDWEERRYADDLELVGSDNSYANDGWFAVQNKLADARALLSATHSGTRNLLIQSRAQAGHGSESHGTRTDALQTAVASANIEQLRAGLREILHASTSLLPEDERWPNAQEWRAISQSTPNFGEGLPSLQEQQQLEAVIVMFDEIATAAQGSRVPERLDDFVKEALRSKPVLAAAVLVGVHASAPSDDRKSIVWNLTSARTRDLRSRLSAIAKDATDPQSQQWMQGLIERLNAFEASIPADAPTALRPRSVRFAPPPHHD
jgi:hypothetical protein